MGNPIKVQYINKEPASKRGNPYKNDMPFMAYGGSSIEPDKALAFLQDGTIYGHPLTEKQQQAFALAAGVDLDEEGNPILDQQEEQGEDSMDQEDVEYRYGGQKRLPKGTRKNIKTSINSVMRRNTVLYGESGKHFYNPYYKEQGGQTMKKNFNTPPTADQFFYYGPPTPGQSFYKQGGEKWNTNEIAFPQQPPANVFFAGANWQSQFGQGGQPCMNCGGTHYNEGGQHQMPNGAMMLDEDMPDGNVYKKGGHWIQGAVNPAHKGYCSPMTKSTCTPRRKAFAMTMKKHHGFHKKAMGGDNTNLPFEDQDNYLQKQNATFMDYVNDNHMNAMMGEELSKLPQGSEQAAQMMMAMGGPMYMPAYMQQGGPPLGNNQPIPQPFVTPQYPQVNQSAQQQQSIYDMPLDQVVQQKAFIRPSNDSINYDMTLDQLKNIKAHKMAYGGDKTKRGIEPPNPNYVSDSMATVNYAQQHPELYDFNKMKWSTNPDGTTLYKQPITNGKEGRKVIVPFGKGSKMTVEDEKAIKWHINERQINNSGQWQYPYIFGAPPQDQSQAQITPMVKKFGGPMEGLRKFFPGGPNDQVGSDECTDADKMNKTSPCYDPNFVPGQTSYIQQTNGYPATADQLYGENSKLSPQNMGTDTNPQTQQSSGPYNNGMVIQKKQQGINGEGAANWLLAGINGAASLFEARDRKKQEAQMKSLQGADAQFYNQRAGNRGTYDQQGQFRPNSMVPVQQPGNPYGQMGSMYSGYEEGGEYYLSDDEVDNILKNGGQIEFLED